MPPRSDKACDVVVLEAIKGAHFHVGRNFRHKCNIHANAMKATPTPGSRINDYNNYVSNGITITTLLDEKETYGICSNMKKKIDEALKKRDREAAAASATNASNTNVSTPGDGVRAENNNTNNTNTIHDPPPGGGVTAAGNNNTNTADPPVVAGVVVVGGIMLPRTSNINIKQETSLAAAEIAAAEIASGNDRIIVHEYINRTNSTSAASASSSRTSITNNTSASTATDKHRFI